MFLKEFSVDEKKAFYALAQDLVMSDNKIEEAERNLLAEYQIEMGMVVQGDMTEQDAVDVLNKSSIVTRKKVIFELIGLALCDSKIQAEEEVLLEKLCSKLSVSHEYSVTAEKQIRKYLELVNDISKEIYEI